MSFCPLFDQIEVTKEEVVDLLKSLELRERLVRELFLRQELDLDFRDVARQDDFLARIAAVSLSPIDSPDDVLHVPRLLYDLVGLDSPAPFLRDRAEF